MRIITVGRPLGPWNGHHRVMLLRNGCLLVAVTEMFYSAVVMSGSLGALSATYMSYEDLLKIRKQDTLWWTCFAYIWQAACHFSSFGIGVVALFAYIKRWTILCLIYMGGTIIVHVISVVGLFASFFIVPTLNILLPVTLIRGYGVWIVWAYYLEIRMYPEGFPPPPRKVIRTPKLTTPVPTRPSSIHYVGDG